MFIVVLFFTLNSQLLMKKLYPQLSFPASGADKAPAPLRSVVEPGRGASPAQSAASGPRTRPPEHARAHIAPMVYPEASRWGAPDTPLAPLYDDVYRGS